MAKLQDCFLIVVGLIAMAAATEGLAQTLQADTVIEYLFCALIAFGTGFFAFVFWAAAFYVVPHLTHRGLAALAWTTIVAGGMTLLMMSAWWTSAAIGGQQALLSHYADFVPKAESVLAQTGAGAGEFASILPRIDALARDFAGQAACEVEAGCITGNKGPGGVASFLTQNAQAAESIAETGRQAETALAAAEDEAAACLVIIRSAATDFGAGDAAMAEGIDCFNAAIAKVGGLQAGRQINMSLSGFASGLVIPASVTSERQIEAVNRIIESAKVRSEQLAADAAVISEAESKAVEPLTLTRLNAMQAVVQYWHTIVPAVATSVALDLSPIVLLILRSIMAAAQRHNPDQAVMAMPFGDLLTAVLGSRRVMKDWHEEPPRIERLMRPRPDDETIH